MSENFTEKHFTLLFRHQQARFLGIAFSMVHDMEVAKDIVSESFAAVWEARERISDEELAKYIFGVIKNKCLMHRRSLMQRGAAMEKMSAKERRLYEHYTHTIESCEPSELYLNEIWDIVSSILNGLPEPTRNVFIKKKLEGKSYETISGEMNITSANIDYRMRSAMKAINSALKDYRKK